MHRQHDGDDRTFAPCACGLALRASPTLADAASRKQPPCTTRAATPAALRPALLFAVCTMPLRTLEALLSQKGAFWLVHVMLSPCAVLWPPNSLHCAVPAQAVPSVLAAGSVVPDQATAWALRCNCSDIPPSRSCFRAGRRCTALLSAACRVLAPRAGGRGVEAARPLAPVRLYVAVCARRPHPSPSRSCTAWAPAAPRWREARGGVGAGAFPWCHDIISCVDVGSRDIPTFCLTPRSLLSWCFLAPDIVPHRPRRRLFDRSNAGAERCCHAAGRRQARYTSLQLVLVLPQPCSP